MGEDVFYRSFLNRNRLVHIADGDASTCEALSVLFRLEGFQTAFAVDQASLFAAIERRRPDALVLNMRLGGDDGIAVLRRLKGSCPRLPVFMLGKDRDVGQAVQAMKAGAADVITKPVDTDYLVRAVTEALRQDAARAAAVSRRQIEPGAFTQLTPREREVLQLITNGQSNKEAGRELGISPRTIEVHRARVMEKLGARNTADLMRIVLSG